MFALNNTIVFGNNISDPSNKQQKGFTGKNNVCISPIVTKSPFSIPDSPQYMSTELINKINNIQILKKIEYEYDNFLEKKCQILMLLNNIDEIFEIRDSLTLRINSLRKKERLHRMRNIRGEIL
jgi:hypothetical protein